MGQPILTSKHKNAWVALLKVAVTLSKQIESELKLAGKVSIDVYDVLISLEDAPGGKLTMTDLAETVVVSPSGVTRLVDRMVKSGLVCRETNSSDGRSKFACITESGLAARIDAGPVVLECLERIWGSKLSAEEAQMIQVLMNRLVGATRTFS